MVDNAPRVLSGRYEVGELIGRGGMAEVHIGHDSRLGRTVAIKILRSDLARDPSFLARFRREAQAAASLNHPAVVAVYDTGEDELTDPVTGEQIHIPFIVMEYVEGHTVREILTHGNAVPIDEAVEITMGVLSALEYSHHAGIVHRDIKPANVMITSTGAVKVMDFGIARAVADSAATMTQTQAVIGTAQYLSPEQARGETVDARSDLYSTGCLLFELLTGRPPFVGDSPVAVAYQHVGQQPLAPSELASDVPPALDRITLKALAKERDTRYSSAAEFRADLERFLAGQEPLAGTGALVAGITGTPGPGTGPIGTGPVPVGSGAMNTVQMPSAGATLAMPGVAATQALRPTPPGTAGQPTVAFNAPGSTGAATEFIAPAGLGARTPAQCPPPRALQQAPAWAPVAPAPVARPVQQQPYVEPPRRSKAWLAFVIPLLLLGAGFLAWHFLGSGFGGTGLVEVPTLAANVTREDAQRIIEDAGLRFNDVLDTESTLPNGAFVRQDPAGGEEVPNGSEVTVWFSASPESFPMPDLTGMTQRQAIDTLHEHGLVWPSTFEEEHSATVPRNNVARTVPAAGDPVERDTTIAVFISTGLVELQDLRGWPQADAVTYLQSLGLQPHTRDVEDASAAPGTVVSHTPGPGTVEQGTSVQLNIAVAPAVRQVPVPTVVGLPWNSSTQALFTQNQLVASVAEQYSDTVPAGSVISTNPAGGTQVNQGTTVTVVVSRGSQQVAPPPVAPTDLPVDPGYPGGGDNGQYGAGSATQQPGTLDGTTALRP